VIASPPVQPSSSTTSGTGLGEHDVRRRDGQPGAQRREGRQRAAGGEHHVRRADPRAAAVTTSTPAAPRSTTCRTRVCSKTRAPRSSTRAAGRAPGARLHGRRRRQQHARRGTRATRSVPRTAAASSARTRSAAPCRAATATASSPDAVLRLRRRDDELPAAPEPRVDALALAPGGDRVDRVLGRAGDGQRAVLAEARDQRRQVEPQVLDEPAVAAARPVAAHVGLQDDDPRVGRRPQHVPRRPQPAVAAADHDDVGVQVACERRGGDGRAEQVLLGLVDPPAACRVPHRPRSLAAAGTGA
jgi:hypothetical protein